MVKTLGGFLSKVKKQYKDWGSPKYVWFRGEPESETRLLPKLYRPKSNGESRNENKLLQMFRMKAQVFSPIRTPSRDNTDEWLFLAQHVGIPTRLLDWTENALVALYFAIENHSPTVWMLDPLKLNNFILQKLQQIGTVVKEFDEFPLPWYRPKEPIINIGHENIRGAWELGQKGIDYPVAIHPTYLHPRMSAQRSVFTVHGKIKEPIDTFFPPDIIMKIKIDNKSRNLIINELIMLGIQQSAIYPDLEGLAKELSSLY